MLFFVRFDVTQPANVSNQDLIETWRREAEAAIGAMDAGAVPHLWKVAGQRVVLAVVDLPTAEDLDAALGGLPIIREMGPGVKTEAWPIYDYRAFAAALDDGTHGG
jgi:muconolactone delta-isomerase